MATVIIFITLLSGTITFCLTPLVIYFAKKYGLVDNPKVRPHPAHTHHGIIPRAGGIAIFLGIFIPILYLFIYRKDVVGIAIGAFILIAIGIWDDKQHRSPYIRFFMNCLAALVVIGSGVGIPYITNPLGGIIHLDIWKIPLGSYFSISVLADVFALLWIVWTTNIVGWSGGVDGQMPGYVAISAMVIGLLSLRFAVSDPNQLHVAYLAFATTGAFLGFIPWNFFPQKIMPGYGGKTLAGFMLAVLSILSFSKLGTALFVLAVPMTDALFITFKRISLGKSPMMATSGHLHHHLLKMGWSKRQVALFYWVISAITGIIALTLKSQHRAFAVILVMVIVLMFILWINLWTRLPKKTDIEDY